MRANIVTEAVQDERVKTEGERESEKVKHWCSTEGACLYWEGQCVLEIIENGLSPRGAGCANILDQSKKDYCVNMYAALISPIRTQGHSA